jgi:hypothetical protein
MQVQLVSLACGGFGIELPGDHRENSYATVECVGDDLSIATCPDCGQRVIADESGDVVYHASELVDLTYNPEEPNVRLVAWHVDPPDLWVESVQYMTGTKQEAAQHAVESYAGGGVALLRRG